MRDSAAREYDAPGPFMEGVMKPTDEARRIILTGLETWTEKLKEVARLIKGVPEHERPAEAVARLRAARAEICRLLDEAETYGMEDPIVMRLRAARSQWPAN